MSKDDLATLKRLWGDSTIVKDILGDVCRGIEDGKMDETEYLYHLRKVVRKNDEINGVIEKEFWKEKEEKNEADE